MKNFVQIKKYLLLNFTLREKIFLKKLFFEKVLNETEQYTRIINYNSVLKTLLSDLEPLELVTLREINQNQHLDALKDGNYEIFYF